MSLKTSCNTNEIRKSIGYLVFIRTDEFESKIG